MFRNRSDPPEVEERATWPLILGGVGAAGVVLAGLLTRRDRLLWRVQEYVEVAPTLSETGSMLQVGGLMVAFALTQLPVEELKLRLLAGGALQERRSTCPSEAL